MTKERPASSSPSRTTAKTAPPTRSIRRTRSSVAAESSGAASSSSESSSSSSSRVCFHAFILLAWSVVFVFGWWSLFNTNIRLTTHYYAPTSSQTRWKQKEEDDNDSFHFCKVPKLRLIEKNDNSTTTRVNLLYQCSGPPYERFADELHSFVKQKSQNQTTTIQDKNENDNYNDNNFQNTNSSSSFWGRRPFPLPANKSVLVLGNSHLRQVSKTLLCQYAHQVTDFQQLRGDSFIVTFSNNATWISITNTVLVYSTDWLSWIGREISSLTNDNDNNDNNNNNNNTPLLKIDQMDAMVFGKFTSYQEALNTNFEHMMQDEQDYYERRQQHANKNDNNNTLSPISFATTPPPTLTDAAIQFSHDNNDHNNTNNRRRRRRRPIVSVSMFSTTDIPRFQASKQEYIRYIAAKNDTNDDDVNDNTSVHFLNARRYIDNDNFGLECGSDDKLIMGTCHEPGDIIPNSNRNPADMHRCAGHRGGHADLIAWDLIGILHDVLVEVM